MKIYRKEKLPDGQRVVYLFGVRIFSYKLKKDQEAELKKEQETAKLSIQGQNNVIELANPNNPGLTIQIYGDNNTVRVHTKDVFNAHICIGMDIYSIHGCTVEIGKDTTSCGIFVRILENNSTLTIGEDCQLSSDIAIYVSDTHSIINKEGQLINIGRFVEIGDHVWVGYDCKILKNTRIPSNCIVGMGAIVTAQFSEQNCVLAGNPARIVKRDVNWERRYPQMWLDAHAEKTAP